MLVNSVNRYTHFFKRGKLPFAPSLVTKGQCKVSEEELVERVNNLAKKDAAAGKDSQNSETLRRSGRITTYSSAQWRKLRDDYISFASPDRAGIIQKKLDQMSGRSASMGLMGAGRTVTFAVLFASHQRSRLHRYDPDVGANFVSFKDEWGKEIARYSETCGWDYFDTREESMRRCAFDDLWKQALADAQEELELQKEALAKKEMNQELAEEALLDTWA